mmetsp:Transcript_29112/g.84185  ORF Transcript_29112/g.84185 Transcript_29112/m.84185 type:complete len:100 (+) Transcript_29112:692-991(+)
MPSSHAVCPSPQYVKAGATSLVIDLWCPHLSLDVPEDVGSEIDEVCVVRVGHREARHQAEWRLHQAAFLLNLRPLTMLLHPVGFPSTLSPPAETSNTVL